MLVGLLSLPTLHWPVTKSSKQGDDAVGGGMNTQNRHKEHDGAWGNSIYRLRRL